ncbi:MAG: hypothetical protein JSW33_08895 [bacterium]|nr:MAG: hypothetical protein JSW33_08895 [bacterium]
MFQKLNQIKKGLSSLSNLAIYQEEQKLLLGKLLIENKLRRHPPSNLTECEFKIFSQWGEDGIIQWLVNNLEIEHKSFIEFGVEDYRESNTRFLMMNDNWSGLIMDSSESQISKIKQSEYYWKYDLQAKTAFVDCENINDLILTSSFENEIGLLSIDIDGNDYWIWKKFDVISPVIVVIEYNGLFGIDRAITVPYDKNFNRTNKHYSNLFFGSSLKALQLLAQEKGYAFIGCTSAGNDAFFVRKDKLNQIVKEKTLKEGYVLPKSRQNLDIKGNLTYKKDIDQIELMRGMPILNVVTNKIESF